VATSSFTTLRDVADAAGVHVSTVSLAMGGSPKLARATGERLRRLAAEMGYRPNPVFLALTRRRLAGAQARPPLIVFLTNRPSLEEFHRVPHMPGFLAGAQEQAARMGFACELALTGAATSRSAAPWYARSDLQGVILAAFLPLWPGVSVDLSAVAVAKIDSPYLYPAAPRISYDLNQIVGTAWQHLHARGYRRIGLAIGQFDEDSSDQLYRSAFLVHQHLLGHRPIPPLQFTAFEPVARSAERVRTWARRHRLDAVISNWGNLVALVRRAGFAVPRELACVGLCLPSPDPAISGLVMDHAAVGRKAVETVALLIRSPLVRTADRSITLVPGIWHDGASLAAHATR
jgi:LacI family transcriptional regulator